MNKLRITKQFSFEMAHALDNHDGPCKNIHGHSYKFSVTVLGDLIDTVGDPKEGMVMDFTDLKVIIKEEVLNDFDHALVLFNDSPLLSANEALGQRIIGMNNRPTCEHLLLLFVKKIRPRLDKRYKLVSAQLRETAANYAEWQESDNL